jgi:hypothetical protein
VTVAGDARGRAWRLSETDGAAGRESKESVLAGVEGFWGQKFGGEA